ncbi:MAG TPA: hypothetical protein VJT73_09020 [Polyangiaceae bacterium]|nr:hypothetical protein [Polyangiaceae bacterium]
MSQRCCRLTRTFVFAVGVFGGLLACGCDPKEDPAAEFEGPPFLIVAPAAEQAVSPNEGTTIYVQARGGSYVGITTHGGSHRYQALEGDSRESCAELPGSAPLYVIVKPDDVESLVEVRLYADCDEHEGGSALQMCNNHESFVQSVVVAVKRPLLNPPAASGKDAGADAKADAAKADAAMGDAAKADAAKADAAKADAAVAASIQDARADSPSTDARADR